MNTQICLLLTGLLVTNLPAADRGDRERAFVKSLEQFDSAKTPDDYREVARTLESIVSNGYQSGAVYYNLGNAYYRAGEYGRAILNYRKAKPYRPRDPYLTANLEQAIAASPGHLPESPAPWWSHVLFWSGWMSYPTKIHVVFFGLTLAAVTTLSSVLLQKKRLHWITASLLVVSLAVGIDGWIAHAEITSSDRAVITGETTARKGTGTSYEAAFDQPLRDGAEFRILKETSDWTFGHFENIGDGWVRNEFVAK